RRERHKGLTAERMPLHHPQAVRQGTGLGAEYIDENARVFARCLNLGQIMEAAAIAIIDEEVVRSLNLDDIAERPKRLARKRPGENHAHRPPRQAGVSDGWRVTY